VTAESEASLEELSLEEPSLDVAPPESSPPRGAAPSPESMGLAVSGDLEAHAGAVASAKAQIRTDRAVMRGGQQSRCHGGIAGRL
jgi:hypothetical protein